MPSNSPTDKNSGTSNLGIAIRIERGSYLGFLFLAYNAWVSVARLCCLHGYVTDAACVMALPLLSAVHRGNPIRSMCLRYLCPLKFFRHSHISFKATSHAASSKTIEVISFYRSKSLLSSRPDRFTPPQPYGVYEKRYVAHSLVRFYGPWLQAR